MRVLSRAEVRAFERRAIEEIGIPPLILMENAAAGVADAIGERYPDVRRVALYCGPGNNGADGLALARQLVSRGYEVEVATAWWGGSPSSEARAQLGFLERLGIRVRPLADSFTAVDLEPFERSELTVDALFGSGLSRPLTGAFARLVERLSAAGRPVVAIDLPSGLDGDLQEPNGPAIRADLTVTFAAPKPAQVLGGAAALCGEVVVADLGVPWSGEEAPGGLHLLVGEELATALVGRPRSSHKGDFGHLLIVAGNRGMAGAAVLAARAAVASGAGKVTVATVAELVPALAQGCPEAMTLALPATPSGSIARAALPALEAAAAERTALAVGPGLGRDPETAALVRELCLATAQPMVLDADGLDAWRVAGLEGLAARRGPALLTPHPGELGRLLGRPTAEIQADRLASARAGASRAGAVLILKGDRTIVATSAGEAWVNSTGNPGMASGGSGDVLTGLLGARLAQGDDPDFAACLSVHLHGLAGDLALERAGGPAVPASSLVAHLGAAWEALRPE